MQEVITLKKSKHLTSRHVAYSEGVLDEVAGLTVAPTLQAGVFLLRRLQHVVAAKPLQTKNTNLYESFRCNKILPCPLSVKDEVIKWSKLCLIQRPWKYDPKVTSPVHTQAHMVPIWPQFKYSLRYIFNWLLYEVTPGTEFSNYSFYYYTYYFSWIYIS